MMRFHDQLLQSMYADYETNKLLSKAGDSVYFKYKLNSLNSTETLLERREAYAQAKKEGFRSAPSRKIAQQLTELRASEEAARQEAEDKRNAKKNKEGTQAKKAKGSRAGKDKHPYVTLYFYFYDYQTESRYYLKGKDTDAYKQCTLDFLEILKLIVGTSVMSVKRRLTTRDRKALLTDIETLRKSRISKSIEPKIEEIVGKLGARYVAYDVEQDLENWGWRQEEKQKAKRGREEKRAEEANNSETASVQQDAETTPSKGRHQIRKSIEFDALDEWFRTMGQGETGLPYSFHSPEYISQSDREMEKLDMLQEIASDNNMTGAFIPILMDQKTGCGLYILGENYFSGWPERGRERKELADLFGNDVCQFAIITFQNLYIEDMSGGEGINTMEYWAPYSYAGFMYEGITPGKIIFDTPEKALQRYMDTIRIYQRGEAYQTIQSCNKVTLKETWDNIPPEFAMYFSNGWGETIEDEWEKQTEEAAAKYLK